MSRRRDQAARRARGWPELAAPRRPSAKWVRAQPLMAQYAAAGAGRGLGPHEYSFAECMIGGVRYPLVGGLVGRGGR